MLHSPQSVLHELSTGLGAAALSYQQCDTQEVTNQTEVGLANVLSLCLSSLLQYQSCPAFHLPFFLLELLSHQFDCNQQQNDEAVL